jgi:hypothetical protein
MCWTWKYKNNFLNLEKQQKNFDKILNEAKALSEQLMIEKERVEREAHEKATRLLNLARELDERNN